MKDKTDSSRRSLVTAALYTAATGALGPGLLGCASGANQQTFATAPPTGATTVTTDDIRSLAQALPNAVFTRGSFEYEASRLVWNGTIDQFPALVVHARTREDIVKAVRFAAAHGLGISIKATGHGALKAAGDDAMLIDTSRMKGIEVDAKNRIATLEPGVTAIEYLHAILPHGLVGPTAVSPHVGMTGYTLAGGYGDLPRVTGLSSDNLLSADVVLSDGQTLTVSAHENSDLFWALRGGGGNFAIVTSMRLRLHPVGDAVLSGVLTYDAANAKRVIGALREWETTIPDEMQQALSLFSSNVAKAPYPVVTIALIYFGKPEEGQKYIDKLVAATDPVGNTVRRQTYLEYFDAVQDPGFGLKNFWHGVLIDQLSDPVIDVLVKAVEPTDSEVMLLFSYYRGGAWSRHAEDFTAVSHRNGAWLLNGRAIFKGGSGDEARVARAKAQVAALAKGLAPFTDGAVPMTYVEYEGPARLADVYGEAKLARLREIKRRYDPQNRLRFNANIPPAQAA